MNMCGVLHALHTVHAAPAGPTVLWLERRKKIMEKRGRAVSEVEVTMIIDRSLLSHPSKKLPGYSPLGDRVGQ